MRRIPPTDLAAITHTTHTPNKKSPCVRARTGRPFCRSIPSLGPHHASRPSFSFFRFSRSAPSIPPKKFEALCNVSFFLFFALCSLSLSVSVPLSVRSVPPFTFCETRAFHGRSLPHFVCLLNGIHSSMHAFFFCLSSFLLCYPFFLDVARGCLCEALFTTFTPFFFFLLLFTINCTLMGFFWFDFLLYNVHGFHV